MFEDHSSNDNGIFGGVKSRDFKCPCGKTYLSYPALFTHIKQKHQGKAPGRITKPGVNNLKRGRPSLKSKCLTSQQKQCQGILASCPPSISVFCQAQQSPQQASLRVHSLQQCIKSLATLIQQIPCQPINKLQLNQIQAFTQMTVIIYKPLIQEKQSNTKMISLSKGLIQFMKELAQKVSWGKFQQVYVMFMLFLQFIIDEQNDKTILKYKTMDLLCQYVNQFYQNHLHPMAQYYGVQSMTILKADKPLNIFDQLFIWMMNKNYTTYIISYQGQYRKQKCVQTSYSIQPEQIRHYF